MRRSCNYSTDNSSKCLTTKRYKSFRFCFIFVKNNEFHLIFFCSVLKYFLTKNTTTQNFESSFPYWPLLRIQRPCIACPGTNYFTRGAADRHTTASQQVRLLTVSRSQHRISFLFSIPLKITSGVSYEFMTAVTVVARFIQLCSYLLISVCCSLLHFIIFSITCILTQVIQLIF